MKAKPMLGDWEIPRVESIRMDERRGFVELPVPGRTGSLFQDLDAWPSVVRIRGSLYGDEPRSEFLEKVREKFRAGEPVTFTADIATATTLRRVLIEVLEFDQDAGRPDETRYRVVLRESPPPPPEPDPSAAVDASIVEEASGLADKAASAMGAVGRVPNLTDPTGPLQDSVRSVKSATEGLDQVLGGLTEKV